MKRPKKVQDPTDYHDIYCLIGAFDDSNYSLPTMEYREEGNLINTEMKKIPVNMNISNPEGPMFGSKPSKVYKKNGIQNNAATDQNTKNESIPPNSALEITKEDLTAALTTLQQGT
jgi:hypothetical protein